MHARTPAFYEGGRWEAAATAQATPDPPPDLLPPCLRSLDLPEDVRDSIVAELVASTARVLRAFELAAFCGGGHATPPTTSTIGYNVLALARMLNIGPITPHLGARELRGLGYEPRNLAAADKRIKPYLDL